MKYIYPVNIDGVISEYTGSFTNEYYVNDQNIEGSMTGIHNTDALRFNLGSVFVVDSVAFYVTSGTGTANIHKNFTPSASLGSGTLSGSGVWNIITFSSTSSQYWNTVFSGVSSLEISEIFIAYTFDFPYNFNLGNSFRKIHDGIDSLGNAQAGGSVTNKRHGSHWGRTWDWSNFSGTNTDDFETFDEAVGGTRAKFLWYDDSSYHWVKQAVAMNYTEATYDAHDLSSGLIEQLF